MRPDLRTVIRRSWQELVQAQKIYLRYVKYWRRMYSYVYDLTVQTETLIENYREHRRRHHQDAELHQLVMDHISECAGMCVDHILFSGVNYPDIQFPDTLRDISLETAIRLERNRTDSKEMVGQMLQETSLIRDRINQITAVLGQGVGIQTLLR